MRTTSQRLVVLLVSVLAVGVTGAAIAWACTPQATIGLSSAGADASGETVTVTGENWLPPAQSEGQAPVEIRWDSVNGPLLATDQGPTINVTIAIPDAQPDTHWVYAVVRGANGEVFTRGAQYVIGAGSAPGTAQQPGQNSNRTSGAVPQRGQARTPGSASGRTSGGEAAEQDEPASARVRAGARSRLVTPSREPAVPSAPAPEPASPAEPAVAPQTAPVTAPATAAPRTAAPSRSGAATQRATARDSVPRPSERSASGDLWSGFAAAAEPATRAPAPVALARGGRAGLVVLFGLLGTGLLLFAGGVMVAGRRRSRV